MKLIFESREEIDEIAETLKGLYPANIVIAAEDFALTFDKTLPWDSPKQMTLWDVENEYKAELLETAELNAYFKLVKNEVLSLKDIAPYVDLRYNMLHQMYQLWLNTENQKESEEI